MSNPAQEITVEVTVNVPLAKAWLFWTLPEHITGWNFATDDWQCPRAENDPRTGGKFSARMEARDGSMGFDFEGVYDEVVYHKLIAYSLGDVRKVRITFAAVGDHTHIVETFDAETENPIEMQRSGWQAILNNFKKYSEGQ